MENMASLVGAGDMSITRPSVEIGGINIIMITSIGGGMLSINFPSSSSNVSIRMHF
jgi:hypothetical protein